MRPLIVTSVLLAVFAAPSPPAGAQRPPSAFDVRDFGAGGDGTTLDTDAINRAIAAAARAGGGTVNLPAGRYLSFSIRLASHVTLRLAPGAVLVAADPATHHGRYDAPEPNQWDLYQDFGHSHWQNSLIWGIDLEDVAIVGPGLIDGAGLTRGGPGARWSKRAGDRPLSMGAAAGGPGDPEALQRMDGLGNKAIALKRCRNVTLQGFSVLNGGHFAVLATGVDNLAIDNLRIDTNRDGLDLDACRNVRISNVSVNSPNDDAIVLKSSFALGEARPTENVTITNCQVSGYDIGSMLDGSFRTTQTLAPDRDGVTGRIKLGTESNGGYRNIAISNCVFDRSRGLALETVDGGALENVTATNLTMRHVTTAPLFIRLGNRGRGPDGTPVGSVRRVTISNVVASDIDPRYPALVAGLPDHPVEGVLLSGIRLLYRGGGTAQTGQSVPEHEDAYPEPSMFGTLPSWGLYVRHARDLTVRDFSVETMAPDARPPVMFDDASKVTLDHLDAPPAQTPLAVLRRTRDLVVRNVGGIPDRRVQLVESGTLP